MATQDISKHSIQQAQFLGYKTPFFFTERATLQKNYEAFQQLLNAVEVCYALKANSDPKILMYLDSLGSGFEAASAYEVEILLNLGVSPQKILYGTSIKPIEHIQFAHAAGVHRFAADSREELDKIAENAPGAKVYVRVIVDDAGSVFMMSERFGAPPHTAKDLLHYAHSLNLKTYGISFYVGSQATQPTMWSNGIRTVKPIIEELLHEGITLEAINIGGGFPVPYANHSTAPTLSQIGIELHNALNELPYRMKVIMEPGRGIVASSTVLVSEIIARNDRGGHPWLCLDAGIYNALFEAMIHQGSTQYPVRLLHPPTEPVELRQFTLTGPTGDSLDIIARHIELPAYLSVGDKLVFEHAGAYTISMASRFNGFPEPELYLS